MENQDTFLADWLAGTMSDEDLRSRVTESEYAEYLLLRGQLSRVTLQEPSIDGHFARIKEKMQQPQPQQPRRRLIRMRPVWAIAACLLVLLGFFMVLTWNQTVQTGYGQGQEIELPDGSTVWLSAHTRLSYNRSFVFNRKLTLEGEAYFEVAKGSRFTVMTQQGSVAVLGTKFQVMALPRYFGVHCDEGRVQVQSGGASAILTPGKSVGRYLGALSQWESPVVAAKTYQTESRFSGVPVAAIFEKIQNEYGVNIDYPDSVGNVRFTGTISHENLDLALAAVCVPLQLKSTRTPSGKIVIVHE